MSNASLSQPQNKRLAMNRPMYKARPRVAEYNSLFLFPRLPSKVLPSGVTAVHAQVTTGHEAAGVAEQKYSSTAIFLRARQAAQHVLLGPLIATLGELGKELLNHGSHDVARGDGVDTNVVLAPLGGEVATQLEDSGFAGIIGRADKTLFEQKSQSACNSVLMREEGGEEVVEERIDRCASPARRCRRSKMRGEMIAGGHAMVRNTRRRHKHPKG